MGDWFSNTGLQPSTFYVVTVVPIPKISGIIPGPLGPKARVDTGWHGLTRVDTGPTSTPHHWALSERHRQKASRWACHPFGSWKCCRACRIEKGRIWSCTLYSLFCPLPALSILINPKFVIFIESAIPFITSYNWQMARTVVFEPRERDFAANLGWWFSSSAKCWFTESIS